MAKKSKKARECPALERVLSPAECGGGRGATIDCPAHCGFYPLGVENESALAELETEWVNRAMRRLVDRLGTQVFKQRLEEQRLPLRSPDLAMEYAILTGLQMELFHRPDAEGRTEAAQWEAEGWAGLNNDLRVMMRHRQQARPKLLEVREVLDERRVRCADLLNPDAASLTLFGSNQTGQNARFGGLLAWVVPYPHYHRNIGIAVQLTPALAARLREEILQGYAAAQQERGDLALDDFLVENFRQFCRWALDADQEERAEGMEGVIAYRALYALNGPVEEAEQLLAAAEDFSVATDLEPASETERGFDWHPRESGEEHAADGTGVEQTGSEEEAVRVVLLDRGECWITCRQPEERTALRTRLEALLGERITFQREEDLDLGATMQVRAQQRRLVEVANQFVFSQASEEQSRSDAPVGEEPPPAATSGTVELAGILDESLSWLDGKTIREAAKDASLRPKLVQGLKSYIYGLEIRGAVSGTNAEWTALLEELGLDDLK